MTSVDDCADRRPLNEHGRLGAMHTGQRIHELRLADGEAVMLRPRGLGWRVEVRLRVEDWAALPVDRPRAPGGRRQ